MTSRLRPTWALLARRPPAPQRPGARLHNAAAARKESPIGDSRQKPQQSALAQDAARLDAAGAAGGAAEVARTYAAVDSVAGRFLHPIQWTRARMAQMGFARDAYLACSAMFEDEAGLRETCALPATFQAWFGVTSLHVWMVHARLRAEGDAGRRMYAAMVEHLWVDAEIKLHEAGVTQRFNSIMKELVDMFHGARLAYDEGVYRGDPVLAAALWRNVYNADPLVLPSHLLALVTHVRRGLVQLDQLSGDELLRGRGVFAFDTLAAPAGVSNEASVSSASL